MDRSERTDKLLNIIDRLLGIIEYEQLCDALDTEDIEDLEEFEEDDDYEDCRSHINEEGLPENNLVKCIGVDKDGNGIYKFK